MEVKAFINNYKEAFGEKVELPMVFWYSETPEAVTEKINGCFFKALSKVRNGESVSLNAETIGCGGGKFYTGFTGMPERVPNFVSLKEKYKKTPEMVLDFIQNLEIELTEKKYLNFSRIDKIDSFDDIEGVLFYATPDVLSGLASWTFFDNNSENAVTTPFGSGCSVTISQAIYENRIKGRRTFLGLFDPSVRPYVEANIVGFIIPMSRFREMYHTIKESCLFDTHAWGKVRQRINE